MTVMHVKPDAAMLYAITLAKIVERGRAGRGIKRLWARAQRMEESLTPWEMRRAQTVAGWSTSQGA